MPPMRTLLKTNELPSTADSSEVVVLKRISTPSLLLISGPARP